MTHVVVLGGGLGGLSAAYEIRHVLSKQDKVTVVSNKPFFQFTPSNPWVAVGWRTKKDITLDLASILPKHKVDFVCSSVEGLDPDKQLINLEDGSSVSYDYLVIATGPDLAFDEIEGLGPNGHTISVCDVDHAVSGNEKWEAFCADPGPIVVGAVQGASCYGPAYETAMIFDTDLRRRKLRDQVPMTFVTSEPYVGHLGLGGVGDTKGLLESGFRERTVNWITNAKVDKVEDGVMHVTEHTADGEVKKQHELPFKHSMMLPAFRGIPALMGIDGLVNPRGFVIVDKHQRNPKYPNIFGVGVCIAIPPYEKTPVPVGVPKTGYMIESMVTASALNLSEILKGEEPTHQATWNAICLADFGDSGIAFVAMPQIPPRNTNYASQGKWVHLAKIAFEKYFLRKIRKGDTEPYFERVMLKMLDIGKIKS
ncbi:NAD(P)/FAD-dependent oxidoreductase [Cohaesibacter celericrescens]|jgi:sulfide:quinone oxidoreductase|uniref:Sulfide-quinone reductase n=1 Tax=Cohaesibacter celericrescens TaxID=2067669 RepID=A0A2N5XX94_9HYPH|nr:FAD-dependent oxidoreductase [Cohaesibacter celericrescens]PLW79131.1 pyridine nucleotide-disulfide oxidoreductase [Cohaesibacter celericrescens]